MQDLVMFREYTAYLYNEYYNGEPVHIKYLSTAPSDCIYVEVMSEKVWKDIWGEGDINIWEVGEVLLLDPDGYTFEEFKPILENK